MFRGPISRGAARQESWSRQRLTTAAILIGLLVLIFTSGCAKTKVITDPILGPDHAVTNVFRKEATLPVQIRRVAVLPVSAEGAGPNGTAGRELLEPILHTELSKAGLFDLAFVNPADLQKWTGKERWDYQQTLPKEMLKTIAEQTGADGVLFTRLSRFHAYPPMVIGWRLMLVAAADADILWSVDEVFDAAEEPVSNSARRFERSQVRNNPVLEDSRSILLSPRKFGQYAARAVVQTLPAR